VTRWTRALPVFAIAFPVLYVLAMYFNWPVLTYVPRTRQFHMFLVRPPATQAPAMFYYGWLLTAAFGAAAVGLVAVIPRRPLSRALVALTWIVPLVLVGVVLYILRDWFTH
jgi:hypothetical protein